VFRFLSKSIYDIDPGAFGLDISDESFKFTQLGHRKRGLSLKAFGAGDFPKGAFVDGEIKHEDEVASILKMAFDKPLQGRLSTQHVVCSLPEEHSFTRVIQLPKMDAEQVKEAVKWEAEQHIPMNINDVYLDWQIVDVGGKDIPHQDILISAVPKRLVDGYISMLKKCNLVIKSLEVESVAVSRALVQNLETNEPILLVDLGATRTSFIIFSGTALPFTSSVPVAGNSMIDAISKNYGVDGKEAKRLFYDVGLDKNKEGGRVYKALEPIAKDLAKQIKNYISFYEGHSEHEHRKNGPVSIKKILLCGGVSNLTGLNVYLSLALGVSAEIGNPWTNILKSPLREVPGLSYRKSLGYTTALGLGLSGVSEKK